MDKKECIKLLEEMGMLLELKGENPFKVRAFQSAARALHSVTGDVEELIRSGNILQIKGIGKGIAAFLKEIAENGATPELESLRKTTPSGLYQMIRIPGLGPKKARVLWEKLGIATVGELEYACRENRLLDLAGFGAKSQEKISRGIELLKKFSHQHLLPVALNEAGQLLDAVRQMPGVIRCEIAGSLRRFKETVKDIDLVASVENLQRDEVMTLFTTLPQVEEVTGKGPTKSGIRLFSGISADLRLVKEQEFPFALHHFTGSKEHNVALREIAREKKLKLNEYGLFSEAEKSLSCGGESDIFRQLGLQYIPPELRENMGEIEAAGRNEIPELVKLSDLKGAIHCHSNYSDGMDSIADMAAGARERGYEYIVISDHSVSAFYARGLDEARIIAQHREIDELNRQLNGFKILKSIECDILEKGKLDFPDEILSRFDLVIASIHSRFKMTESEATDRLIKAMENPYVTILGHPTGRLLLAREGYPVNMAAVIEAAAELGVSIEINASPHRLDMDWRYLKQARDKGVKISINPDAHRAGGLDETEYGVGIARKGWLRPQDVLNCLTAGELLGFAAGRRRE
ncbi:MAG: DNA polymerase/3'-5' exonuclease PolX [Calditrichia bacterium]